MSIAQSSSDVALQSQIHRPPSLAGKVQPVHGAFCNERWCREPILMQQRTRDSLGASELEYRIESGLNAAGRLRVRLADHRVHLRLKNLGHRVHLGHNNKRNGS